MWRRSKLRDALNPLQVRCKDTLVIPLYRMTRQQAVGGSVLGEVASLRQRTAFAGPVYHRRTVIRAKEVGRAKRLEAQPPDVFPVCGCLAPLPLQFPARVRYFAVSRKVNRRLRRALCVRNLCEIARSSLR